MCVNIQLAGWVRGIVALKETLDGSGDKGRCCPLQTPQRTPIRPPRVNSPARQSWESISSSTSSAQPLDAPSVLRRTSTNTSSNLSFITNLRLRDLYFLSPLSPHRCRFYSSPYTPTPTFFFPPTEAINAAVLSHSP